MRSQSQIITVALVTLFTMALALSVALICISHIRDNAPDELPSLSLTSAPPLSQPTGAPNAPESQPPDASLGLRFTSNGDGTCVLSGIGTCADASVVIPTFSPLGERVTAIAPMALYGNPTVTAVQIPASVTEIGALALAACPALVYVSVSPQNAFFCDVDGILFSADQSTLLLYPPMRAESELSISVATVRIADMAFYKCGYLSRIRYDGTAAQWDAIRIGSKNYSLTAAAKEFIDEA